VSAVDPEGRTIWIADAHRDEKLTAFVELENWASIPDKPRVVTA
jgi:hypothetical protein